MTIEGLRTLLATGTPGPWRLTDDSDDYSADIEGVAMDGEGLTGCMNAENAALIVAMRAALPALLDVAEAAREWIASVDGFAAEPSRAGVDRGVHAADRVRAALARL